MKWRVWPDGTVQDCTEGDLPYDWMSDDFQIIEAECETDALLRAGVD